MKKLFLPALFALSMSGAIDSYSQVWPEKKDTIQIGREVGLKNIVEHTQTWNHSEAWAFLPDKNIWYNIMKSDPKDSSLYIDTKVVDTLLKSNSAVELYHSKAFKKYQSDKLFNEDLSKYGNIMWYLPMFEDNYWLLNLKFSNPKKDLSLGIVSTEGVLKITPDSLVYNDPALNNEKLNNLAAKITVYMAEFFQGSKVSEFKEKSKNIEGIIKVEFLNYKKDD